MDLRVHGVGNPGPFLSARDLFETEFDLELPVHVKLRSNPDARTWAGHYDDYHVMNVSRRVATSAMARELAVHEFAHMYRYEEAHASHRQSTREALYLALSEPNPDRDLATHALQIANHMKDIYADDLTLSVSPGEKLVSFLESSLANALLSGSGGSAHPITAVNAAFAIGLCERHGLLEQDHRLYDLAHASAEDSPEISIDHFSDRFKSLSANPDVSEYRRELVGTIKSYARAAKSAA